ncbi:MAG: transcription factor S [DPANN group archaeon]|jgi:transcription factor S|nr:transcription factor S [DPANN group archaeon]
MEFCDCGGLMLPTSAGKMLACSKCGKRSKTEGGTVVKEKIVHEKRTTKRATQEIVDTLPMVESDCKKCGNKFAFWWTEQTRGSDEPETQFFRCTKCKTTRREYT